MTIAAAIRWDSLIILSKIETTYGTDSTPIAANTMLLSNVSLAPMEGQDVSRGLVRPYYGAQQSFKVGLYTVLTGDTELVGSGVVGTAPKWGPLARASGLAETIVDATSVAYNPISDAQESVSVYFFVGATRHVMRGTRGNGVLTVNAQGIPIIRWTLTGLFDIPTEQSRPTPDFTGWLAPQVATTAHTPTFTINAISLALRSFALDFGNEVKPRFLLGREEIRLVDRNSMLDVQVDAVPLTTLDPFTDGINLTNRAVSLVHGTGAGKIATIAAPAGSIGRLPSYQNPDKVLEWPLKIALLPTSGNDDWTLTLT